MGAVCAVLFGCEPAPTEQVRTAEAEVTEAESVIRFGLNWEEVVADSGSVKAGQSLSH